MPMTYCEFVRTRPLHQSCHDTEYGFPIRGDSALLERLSLETAALRPP